MKTLVAIEMEALKLYNQLQIGNFFDTYHDAMHELVNQFDYLEIDDEDDYNTGLKLLAQCKAIIKAQKILINNNIY